MEDLFSRTWSLLRNNTILLIILLFETALTLFFRGGQVGFGFNPLMEMAFFFLHLAVLGGWVYQMKKISVQPEERATLDDFLTGVARYFPRMMTGGSLLVFIFMIGFVLSIGLATAISGTPNEAFTVELSKLAQGGNFEKVQSYFQSQPEQAQQLTRWLFTFAAGLAVLGLYLSTLFFWTFWVVLGDMYWFNAWKMSQRSLFKHWRWMLYLGTVWFFVTASIYGLIFIGGSALSVVGFVLSLFAKAYFTLLFVRFWIEVEPDQISPLEESVATS